MKRLDDFDYLVARARQERAIASACEDDAVALVHLEMADEYERRAREMRNIPLTPAFLAASRDCPPTPPDPHGLEAE